MSPEELALAITNAQLTLDRAEAFLNGKVVAAVAAFMDAHDSSSLLPLFKAVTAWDPELTIQYMETLYDELKADLSNARKLDFASIRNAGDWIKAHPLVLQFLARHYTI